MKIEDRMPPLEPRPTTLKNGEERLPETVLEQHKKTSPQNLKFHQFIEKARCLGFSLEECQKLFVIYGRHL